MGAIAGTYVESIPGKCGGKPCIAGTRIRVWDIYVLHELKGKTPDEITNDYPELSLAQIYAALAYYFDHKPEIDAQMKASDAHVEAIMQNTGPGPMARKLAEATGILDVADIGTGDSVSS